MILNISNKTSSMANNFTKRCLRIQINKDLKLLKESINNIKIVNIFHLHGLYVDGVFVGGDGEK